MADTSGDQDIDSTAFRGAMRREKIATREAMPDNERASACAEIDAHLTTLLGANSPRTIAFCWPVRKEFDCRPLVGRLLETGWQACQPVVVAKDASMAFRAWSPDSPMTTDPYGIPVPATVVAAVPDVILLPLVAFDDQGYRLGYGGGYFDRTLAEFAIKPVAIGVGFELGRIDSVRPHGHDVRLDAIVTETGIRRYSDVA
jgi:5,10-methenyltetrahydrofolate synthetase